MRDILARANRPVLARFARSRVLLAFDYDGTLAPIVADPARASMRPATRRLLRRLTRLYPSVVISGRSRRDALSRLAGTGIAGVIGNHGIEPSPGHRRLRHLVGRWRRSLGPVAELPGVTLEDKGFSLAIHYRRARPQATVRRGILTMAASLPGARLVEGKQVVNLVPRRAPHKGTALERARLRGGCETALYVGDDQTDEDVFSLRQPRRILTIRVGRKAGSLAGFCLVSQARIDALLEVLIALREECAAAPAIGQRREGAFRRRAGSRSKRGASISEPAASRTS